MSGTRLAASVLTCLVVGATMPACSDEAVAPVPPGELAPTWVTVTPETVQLSALGATAQLAAEVQDQNGNVMAGVPVTWSSGDTLVATVDAAGLVTASANGKAVITATAGAASDSAIASVSQVVDSLIVSPTLVMVVLGDTVRFAAEALDRNGHSVAGAALVWLSSDASVATVDPSGLVTSVGEGAATITATSGEAVGSAEITVDNPDRAALTALYNATAGLNWANNENWLTDAPLGEWYGVQTDEHGRVVRLDLSGRFGQQAGHESQGLSGPIPPELGSLASLEWLSLSDNDLSGRIPPELGNLASLESLNLGGNRLSGRIPPELGSLASLKWLNLGGNDLTGRIPPELGNLGNLEVLTLHVNDLTGRIPPELGNLASLVFLQLTINYLTGPIPPELGSLASLGSLELRSNYLSGPIPPELGNLANLGRMYLNDNDLTGPIPPELGNLGNLEVLALGDNDLTGRIPPELGSLAGLGVLSLHINDLTGSIPPELGNLVGLERLSLSFNSGLAGPFPRTLLDLQRLRSFSATGSALCAPGTREFVAWMGGPGRAGTAPFCNAADREVLDNLHHVTGGRYWSRSGGWPDGPVLEDWHGVRTDSLGRVTALNLSSNGLSGVLPGDVGALAQLTSLRVASNALTGRLPQSLTELDIEELHYDGTDLCVPTEAGFGTWLTGIKLHQGTGVQCPPLTDRDALMALHGSTGGSGWRENNNWLSDAPLGDWHGVEVDDQGRVVGLQLSDNGLSGPIPPELGGLAHLKQLVLEWNRLTGSIPPELGGLDSLQALSLSGNKLSGPIPRELAGLSDLVYLGLRTNELTGPVPRELGGLANLRNLNASWNHLSGPVPPTLGNLTNLSGLYLEGNGLTGPIPAALGRLPDLRWLYLGNNGLSGPIPAELGGLASLQTLHLDGNELSGPIPPELAGLSELRRLHLVDNNLSGPVPQWFEALDELRRLDLSYNAAMAGPLPVGLIAAAGLEELLASGTDLCAPTSEDFSHWLRRVRKVRISSCGEPPVAYLVQAVQSRSFPVPLVEGEKALLRVFPTARMETAQGIPPIRARFYVDGREIHVENIPGKSVPIPTRVDESSLRSSAAAEISGRFIRPGLDMVIEIDPDRTLDPGLGVARRIPAEGRLSVDVRAMPALDLTLIPFVWTEGEDSSIVALVGHMAADPGGHEMLADVRTLLPVRDIAARAHEPVASTSNSAFDLLSQTEAIRIIEGSAGFYKGMMAPPVTRAGGVAYLPGKSSFSMPYPDIVAHELGHNMNLRHAPCGRPGGPDPAFPDSQGLSGAWGYDFVRSRVVPPSTPDFMSYCGPEWVSDYHFTNALRFRLSDHRWAGTRAVAAPAKSLLLWGGVDPDGQPFLNPTFVVDAPPALPDSTGDYTVTGQSADGRELFSMSFTMPELAAEEDLGSAFVFALPVRAEWADALVEITLSGPERSATLNADSDVAMAILRDPRSGQVRGFLRDAADPAAVQADAVTGAVPGTILDVLYSRGLPDRAAWQR